MAAGLALAGFLLAGAALGSVAPAHAASDGGLRVEDGPSESYGRLEIFHDGEWGAVCDDFFTTPDATVACSQLGYTEGTAKREGRDRPAPDGMGFWLDNVGCAGSESRLDQCQHNGWGVHNCSAHEAVSVSCTGSRTVTLSPPAPQNVRARSGEEHGQITLTWTAPEYLGVITRYQVRHGVLSVQGDYEWEDWVGVPNGAAALSHTFTGLISFKIYAFQVRAMAGTTPGAESEPEHAYPDGPRVSLIVPDDNIDEINGNFVKEGESVTIDAVLTLRPSGSVSVSVTSLNPEAVAVSPASLTFTTSNWNVAQTVTVTGMQDSDADNEYWVGLTFDVARGAASGVNASICVYDDEPAAPRHVAARPGEGHVTLSWTAPSEPYGKDEITGYEYRQCRGSVADCSHDDQFEQWLSAGSSDSHKVTSLDNGQAYTFQVRAVAGTDKGLASSKVTATPGFHHNVALTVGWVHPALADQSPTMQERFSSYFRIGGSNSGPRNGITAGRKLNFAADTSWYSGVRSVLLELTGPKTASRTDSSEPFTLFEDYVGETMPAGDYTLSATAYSEADRGGTAGTKQSVEFTLAEDNDAPTVRVLCSEPKPTGWVEPPPPPRLSSGRRVGVRVLFSELVTGFDLSDVEVSNVAEIKGGMVNSLTMHPTPYSVGFMIPADATGEIQVTVPAGAAEDPAGNDNTASEPLNLAQHRSVSVADARGGEGSTIEFEVMLDAANDCETVTVDYATADGTATAGVDYTTSSGTLTFGPGETTKTVNVAVTDDETSESSEAFTLNLSNAEGATLADAQATGTITETSQQQVLAVPVAATGLDSPSQTQTAVDLVWTLPTQPEGVSVTGVEVQQQAADESWTTVATLASDATTHTVTGLAAGTSYSFRIRLATSSGDAASDAVSARTLAAVNPATGLTASNATWTSVDLSWTLPEQPEGVTVTGVVVRQQAADESGTWITGLAADATTHTVTGLTASTSYSFRIETRTSSGYARSDAVSVDTLVAPNAPTGLAASFAHTRVNLSWTLPDDQPEGVIVSAVEVLQLEGSLATGRWLTVATLAADATSYTVTGLAAGTRHRFRIRLVTNRGHRYSTTYVEVTTLAGPNPATDLTASNETETTVDLAWTLPAAGEHPQGVTVTGVEVRQEKANPYVTDERPTTTVVTLAADATSYKVTGMTEVRRYTYRIRLITNGQGHADSHPVTISKIPNPRPPTGLAASNATSSTVDLSWTLPEQPKGVSVRGIRVWQEVEREPLPWPPYSFSPTAFHFPHTVWQSSTMLGADTTSHTVTGLTPETEHRFRISLVLDIDGATNVDGASPDNTRRSEPVSATTLAAANPATGLAASNPTQTTVELAWTLPSQPTDVTVTGVEVQQQAADESWTAVATLAADATSHTVTGLTAGTAYTFRIRLVTSSGNADSEPAEAQTAHMPLEVRMAGSVPSAQGRDDPGLSPSRSTSGGPGGCRVEVSVEFLDADGNAVAVDALATSDFTVNNGRAGTPVADDDGLGWKAPGWATPGFTGLMRVRLPATERWEAAEQVFRVASDTDCAAAVRNELASLALDSIELDRMHPVSTAFANRGD